MALCRECSHSGSRGGGLQGKPLDHSLTGVVGLRLRQLLSTLSASQCCDALAWAAAVDWTGQRDARAFDEGQLLTGLTERLADKVCRGVGRPHATLRPRPRAARRRRCSRLPAGSLCRTASQLVAARSLSRRAPLPIVLQAAALSSTSAVAVISDFAAMGHLIGASERSTGTAPAPPPRAPGRRPAPGHPLCCGRSLTCIRRQLEAAVLCVCGARSCRCAPAEQADGQAEEQQSAIPWNRGRQRGSCRRGGRDRHEGFAAAHSAAGDCPGGVLRRDSGASAAARWSGAGWSFLSVDLQAHPVTQRRGPRTMVGFTGFRAQ